MGEADIGLIGLAVMGRNLVLNMADNGYRVAIYNRTYERTTSLLADAGPLADRLVGCETLDELVAAIRPPRPVVLMVQAGEPVDEQIKALTPMMTHGDIIMDCGNANYHDTVRRFHALAPTGLVFMGVGVSGGEEGARYGPAIMAGGTLQGYDRVGDILKKIAAKYDGDPCAAYLGSDGAGHFVKTIHNGIEYADMQMIAEVYSIMRHALRLSPAEMSDVFARWNEGPLESYLIEITAKILKTFDPDTGKPMVDVILDRAGQKGTGRWAAIEALDLGIPATTLEGAVAARALSAFKDQRLVERRTGVNALQGDLELPLVAKIKEECHRLPDLEGRVADQHLARPRSVIHVKMVDALCDAKTVLVREHVQVIVVECDGVQNRGCQVVQRCVCRNGDPPP